MKHGRHIIAAALFAYATLAQAAGTQADKSQDRRLFSAVRVEADGGMVLTEDKRLRMPGTSKTRAYLPEGTHLSLTTAIKVRAQGKIYDVELWNGMHPESSEDGGFAEGVAVLAVFPSGAKAPTDIAEVKSDRETYLNDKLLSLGTDDAFELYNAHLNAGEDFNDISLFHLRDGRLRRIAEIGTTGARASDCAESFVDRLHWRIEPQAGVLPDIVADVETIHAPKDTVKEDCPRRRIKERHEHAYTAYHWDAAKDRYVAHKPPKPGH